MQKAALNIRGKGRFSAFAKVPMAKHAIARSVSDGGNRGDGLRRHCEEQKRRSNPERRFYQQGKALDRIVSLAMTGYIVTTKSVGVAAIAALVFGAQYPAAAFLKKAVFYLFRSYS
ncbi:MAG: hypothetical protein LBU47_00365 [Christensenellaceae bacterium]|nr:hypothetical protein [Christensenellaceae bacterium]